MTTPERSVDTICQCRKGSMDDKQFRATVEYNIQSLLTAERQRREEIVLKGERRRIIEQIREERDTYWKERVRKAEPKDRHSSNFESEMYDRGYNHGKADYKRSIEKITNKDNLK